MERAARVWANCVASLYIGVVCAPATASTRTWWVDPSGGPAHFASLNAAVNASSPGDVIRLATGSYVLPGVSGYQLQLLEGITVVGESDAPEDVELVLETATGSQSGLSIEGTVVGVALRPMPESPGPDNYGRLILCRFEPLVEGTGGGMYVAGEGLALATDFLGSVTGRPIQASANAEVRHCRLVGTSSLVHFGISGGVFVNNLVVGSDARSEHYDDATDGWAMQQYYSAYGDPSGVWNNTFVLNAPPDSEGVTVSSWGAWHFTQPGFINNIVAFNHVGGVHDGDADSTDPQDYASFHHNDVYGNPTCQYCTEDPPTDTLFIGGPHYQEDPLFEDLTDDGDLFNDDLHLQAGSPMIDAGDPSLLDPDGSISDVGAYGGPDADLDGDRLGPLTGDCDEGDPTVHEWATEWVNGRDDDCDGIVDEDTTVSDDDGDGYSEADGDCSDRLETIYPGATEILGNGWDDDCDGLVDEDPASDDDTTPPDDDSVPDDDATSPPDDDAAAEDDDTGAPPHCGGCDSARGTGSGAALLALALIPPRRRRRRRLAGSGHPTSRQIRA